MMNNAPTMTRAAGRRTHSLRGGRICPCCAAKLLRRTQRRIEKRDWTQEVNK